MHPAKKKAIDYFIKEEARLCRQNGEIPHYPLGLDKCLDIAIAETERLCKEKAKNATQLAREKVMTDPLYKDCTKCMGILIVEDELDLH